MATDSGTQPSRRHIATGLGALIVPRHVLGGPLFQAPSDTLRIAGVGVGGMGRRYIQGCAGERVVALCDVDHSFAAPVFRKSAGSLSEFPLWGFFKNGFNPLPMDVG